MKRYELALWIVIAAYLLLAAAWAIRPTVFPHEPLRHAQSTTTLNHYSWEMETQFSPSNAQSLIYLALVIATLGLAQTRFNKLFVGECSRTMTAIFLALVASTGVGFWFLSIHRGTLLDHGPDASVRSLSWLLFKIGFVVAITNAIYAIVSKRSAQGT